MERKKVVFYGLAMLVALALTVKVLIPASPPAISPPEKLLFGNDDLLNRSLPSLEYIKTLQPENIPGLHTVSLYSRNDSLKLDYCYPDTLITRLIAPTISPTQTDHPDHQYQTFLATIPEKQKGFFSIEYPELWIPLVLCFTCLLCLFTGRVLYVVTGKLRQKWTGRDTDKPQPLPVRWGNGKWKQATDTAVGLCMSSFIITGLLSMSPIPKWLGDTHTAAEQDRLHPPLLLDNFSMEPYLLLQPDAYGTSANDGEKICMLKLRSYLNKPLVEIIRQKGNRTVQSEYIYAANNVPQRFIVTRPDIVHSLQKLYGSKIPLLRISKLKEYDEYYRPESESKTLPLPVYKVEVDNKTQDLYYFPSSAPTYYHYNSNTKLRKKISDFATY